MEKIKTFELGILNDPRIVSQNRLPPHTDIKWYADCDQKHPLEISLNGMWKFFYAERPEEIPDAFYCGDCSAWAQIQVPGHIQLQGYGVPQYVNYQYPWDGLQQVGEEERPFAYNPVGCYVTEFSLPASVRGQEIHISLDGAESAAALWLNGTYVGYGTDGFTPSEFDLTPYLVDGKNRLSVLVFQWTAASHMECQDFFRFSGLFRSVRLLVFPRNAIRNVVLDTPHELENARHSFELPRAGKTVVRTALRQMGVGGDNTWGAFTHDPYLIHCQPGERMEFEVIVSALSHEEGGSQDENHRC